MLLLSATSAFSASNNLTVAGTTDLWLAGQPNGTALHGGFISFDTAPTNSPVLASNGLNLTAGSYLTFSATGSTNYDGCSGLSPDGNGCRNISTNGFFSISSYNGPINALIGVFVSAIPPSGTAPAGVDFTSGSAQSQASYSPLIDQVFFIGDGLTGTGTGTVQQFVIPTGAVALYLASSDAAGAAYDNSGQFQVTVTDSGGTPAGPTPAPTPAPPSVILTAIGLAMAGIFFWLRNEFSGVKS